MKFRTPAMLTLALILLAGGIWLLMRAGPEANGIEAIQAPDVGNEQAANRTPGVVVPDSASQQERGKIDWKQIGAIVESRVSGREILTEQQVEEFLRKRGETALNLLAASEATGQKRWLVRALELFPDDPALLIAALANEPMEAGRMAQADRLKRVAPDNPLGWIFAARLLAGEGRSAEAMAELREALQKPGFYIYANERISASQRLYTDAGVDPVAAEYLAIAQMPLDHFGAALRTTRALAEFANHPATDPATQREIAQLNYGLGLMFSTPEATRTLIGELVGMSMQKEALKLAAKQENNPLPVNPSARLAEIERQKTENPDFALLTQRMMSRQDAALFAGYLKELRSVGERNALQWLQPRLK